jgi:tagaturonate reductase
VSDGSELPRLDRGFFRTADSDSLPEKVLQFGEGNFLRAFVDWMVHRMNARGLFGGRVVVVQPIAQGTAAALAAQDGLYTVVLRGLERGERRASQEIVSAVSRAIDPYRDPEALLRCAQIPGLRFVVSNTTEAGIRIDEQDRLDGRPPPSFPAKLTQLLWARFRYFDGDRGRGLVMLPCELIDQNGVALRAAVGELSQRWQLPAAFTRWLDEACLFTSTLVDRIVTGRPAPDEAEELARRLGYRDELLVTGEPFHSWVIEGPARLARELPLEAAGLNVTFTSDLGPYRQRKVRVLNGAHIVIAPGAYLAGLDTVRACMEDDVVRGFLEGALGEEILPTLTMPRAEAEAFAATVLDRFRNPFVEHRLLDITLNSVSKFRARVLETALDHARARGQTPQRLAFATAALIAFQRGARADGSSFAIRDEPEVVRFFRELWAADPQPLAVAHRALGHAELWGRDLVAALPGFTEAVAAHLAAIAALGPRAAMARAQAAAAADPGSRSARSAARAGG